MPLHPDDALVLCALTLQDQGDFPAAAELMMAECRKDPMRIKHPSIFWWAQTYAHQLCLYVGTEEFMQRKKR